MTATRTRIALSTPHMLDQTPMKSSSVLEEQHSHAKPVSALSNHEIQSCDSKNEWERHHIGESGKGSEYASGCTTSYVRHPSTNHKRFQYCFVGFLPQDQKIWSRQRVLVSSGALSRQNPTCAIYWMQWVSNGIMSGPSHHPTLQEESFVCPRLVHNIAYKQGHQEHNTRRPCTGLTLQGCIKYYNAHLAQRNESTTSTKMRKFMMAPTHNVSVIVVTNFGIQTATEILEMATQMHLQAIVVLKDKKQTVGRGGLLRCFKRQALRQHNAYSRVVTHRSNLRWESGLSSTRGNRRTAVHGGSTNHSAANIIHGGKPRD